MVRYLIARYLIAENLAGKEPGTLSAKRRLSLQLTLTATMSMVAVFFGIGVKLTSI